MILDQRNHALVVGAVCIMMVSLIHENHRLPGRFRDELAQLILWRNAGGRIVWVTDVDQSLFRSRRHLRKVVAKGTVKRNFYALRAADFRMMKDRLEGWIRDNQLAAARRFILSIRGRSG